VLSTEAHDPCYNFKEVHDEVHDYADAIGSWNLRRCLCTLTPARALACWVQMDTIVITLWESRGRKDDYQLYLHSMQRYLRDVTNQSGTR